MSEYMEKHTVSKLIGSPPGYVGYEQGGLLTEEINKKQHCVLLLDEIEKAHPDIFNILLQILDYGNLSDSNGRKINFKNTLIVMTSNTGAVEAENDSVGFIEQSSNDKYQKAVSKAFTPEFRNRLDGIVNFNSLNEKNLHSVVEKFLIEVQVKLNEKGIDLEYETEVLNYVLQKNTDQKLGARPIARIVEKEIKKPIANLIIQDKARRGDIVSATITKDSLSLKVRSKLKVT